MAKSERSLVVPLLSGLLLLVSGWLPPRVEAQGQSMASYVAECDAAVGVSVPGFQCSGGVTIPTTNSSGSSCDRPNRLNRECDPDSKYLSLVSNSSVEIVGLCRRKGNTGNNYGDIAVIQHNKNTGATCFYQALGLLSGTVSAPSAGTYPWLSPQTTASIECFHCHDNGPIIRSPYLTQVGLLGSGDVTFNKSNPYYFVGADFQSWATYSVEILGNICNSCHRMGTNNSGGCPTCGAARDLGLRATAASEVSKNPHSATSPIWMTPGATTYSSANDSQAQSIATCAASARSAIVNGQSLPNTPICKVWKYSSNSIQSRTYMPTQITELSVVWLRYFTIFNRIPTARELAYGARKLQEGATIPQLDAFIRANAWFSSSTILR